MLDFETLVKSVRLSWFRRLFACENAGWKCYLTHLLKPFGGLFLLQCDYDLKDYNISNQFYAELIQSSLRTPHLIRQIRVQSYGITKT